MLEQNKVLSSGQKIKSIRKLLKINQNDITQGKFNRSLLSYIENDKIPLSKKVAEVISRNINKIAKEKNIPINITTDYLLEDDITQVRRITNRLLDELSYINNINNNITIQKIDELKIFFRNYNVKDLELKFYNLLANVYYRNKEYNESYLSYLQALEACILNNNNIHCKIETLLNMGKCALKLKNYIESISINKQVLALLKANYIKEDKFYIKLYFNLALAYKFLKQYNDCFKILTEMEGYKIQLDFNLRIKIYTLKGNCYLNMHDFNNAEIHYVSAFKIAIENNIEYELGMIYSNLANIYLEKNEINESIKFAHKALMLRKNKKNKKLILTLVLLSEIYMKNKNLIEAEEYILEAINLLENTSIDMELFIKSYNLLLQIYSIENKYKKMEKLSRELEILFQYNMTELEKIKIKELIIRIGYNFMNKDFYKAKLFINKGLNI